MKRISPAVALLLIAPVLGELVSGHQAPAEFFNPVVFAALALPYGCGALLCREFARRWRTGWFGLVLLGIAYALYEEGVVSRALFDPGWHEAAALTALDNVAGVNWSYGFMLVHFHVTVSIVASVMIAEMLFPARRYEPWLSKAQIALCAAVLAAWAPLLALLARADEPLFIPSPHLWLITAAVIVALIFASRFGPPPTAVRELVPAPPPYRFFAIGLLSTTVVLGTVLILPETGWHPPLVVSMPLLAGIDTASLLLILRWSGGGRAWDDRHRLALVAGWLTFFIVFSALDDLDEFRGKTIISAAAVVALLALRRVVNNSGARRVIAA